MKRKLSIFIIIITFCCFFLKANDIHFKLQSKLLLKIISYDKNLSRFGNPIRIGVSSNKMVKTLKTHKLKIKGKSFTVEKMKSVDDIANYNVVYIDNNWRKKYSKITEKAKASSCLVFCNDSNFVESGGGSVSFKLIRSKPKIVVNLDNAKAQGTDFLPEFLKIAVVIDIIK